MQLTPRAYQLSIYNSICQNGNTLVVLPTGLGKCLEFSQPVLFANGTLVKIGELFENHWNEDEILKSEPGLISVKPKKNIHVVSLDDDLKLGEKRIVAIHKIKAKERLLKITTAAGAEITVTPEHPLLTLNEQLEWKRADSFGIGDYVATPARLPEPATKQKVNLIEIFTKINSNAVCFVSLKSPEPGEYRLKSAINRTKNIDELAKSIEYIYIKGGRSNQTPIKAVKELSPELFYWAGLIIAEGCSYGATKFYNEDEDLLEIFSDITQKNFGLRPKKIDGGVKLQSTALYFFARNLFEIKNQHSRDKTISDLILKSDNTHTSQFISALYDGEGSVRKDGLIELMTASKELAHKLSYLLLRFGIKARIKKKLCSATNSPAPKIREYYRVYIEGTVDLLKFMDNIGFRHKEKQRKLREYLSKGLRYNPNFNLIPVSGKFVRSIRKKLKLSSTRWKDFEIPGIDTYERGERKFSHETLRKTIAGFKTKRGDWNTEIKERVDFLERLLKSQIYWDQIKHIERTGGEWVYDLTLDGNFNFVAGRNGGIIAHNTLIALMLIQDRMKLGRCLFLTPTKPLAKQHKDSVIKTLELSEKNVALVTGEITPKKRREAYLTDIIISTPQTIKNDLELGVLKPEFSLIIFDECHRAVGDYAYTNVANTLHEANKGKKGNVLLVGLTASPGGRMDRIREVMGALKIENVEIRNHEDSDVAPYVQKSVVSWVPVELSDHFKDIKKELDSLTAKHAQMLAGMGFPPPLKHKGKFMQLRERILNIPHNIKYPALVQYSILLHLLHMTELLETQGIYPIREYLAKLDGKDSKSAKQLASNPTLAKIRQLCQKDEDHPKMAVLIEIVKKLAKGKQKMIVFVQYRSQIARIEQVLKENGISAKMFVGKKDGVTKKMQEETIAGFRDGKFDVLVASSIGEEGLDIPAVDTVIFYEPVPSEIRSIQRRGRAARMREGQVIVLMTKGTRDEYYYYASNNREKKMKSILGGMQRAKKTNITNAATKNETNEDFKKAEPMVEKPELVVDAKTTPEPETAKKTPTGQTKMTDF